MKRFILNKLNTPKALRQALVLFTLLLLPSIAWAKRYQTPSSNEIVNPLSNSDYRYAWQNNDVKWFINLTSEDVAVSRSGQTTLPITLPSGKSVTLAAGRPTSETGYFRNVKLEGLNQSLKATATFGTTTLTRDNETFEPSAPIQWGSDDDKITITLTNNTSSSISCTISSITILTGTPSSTTFSWADQITSSQGFDVSKISISGSGDNITLSGICVENTTFSFPLNPSTGSPTITYSSSNPEVAEVNSSSGDVTVKKTGEATITAIPVGSDTYYYLPSSYSYTLNISETYQFLNLRIAGTALTSGNVNSQTGAIDGIDGVTFDAQNKILTLENATITSTNTYAIESDLQNLEIKIKGINKLSSGNNAAIHSTNSSGVLSINQYDSTPSSVLLLSGESMSAITGFGSFNTSYKSYYIDANQNQTTELTWSYNSGVLNISGGSYLQNVIFSSITSCGITVGNVRVTNYNANNITGGGITVAEGGKVSYSDGILTLNNATINGRIMTTNPSLTIDLIGSSTISADTFAIKGALDGALSLTFKSDAVPTLIIENSNNNIGLTSVINSEKVSISYLNDLVATGLNTTHAVIAKSYGLNIAGTEVTNANAENITGDNKVAFSASTNTLTLTNAAIGGSIQYTGNSDMTVVINGTNIVGSNSTVSELINTDTGHTAKLTIKKGSDNSSLGFDATSSFNGSSISGFADVTLDGVYLQSDSYCRYVTNDGYKDISNNKIHKLTFTTVPQYQLWVADTQVNEDNKGHILGTSNTTVTFTPASTSEDPSILTLNSATISGSIKSSLNDLTIEVAGSSNTLTAILYEGSSTSSTLLIKTPSSSSTVNKLTLENSTGAVISGFSTVTLDGLFFSTPNYPSVTTSTDWTSSINEAIITNETLSAPTMSSETVDGVSTITLTSTADNSTIKYSIDYVDASQTDITDATYDSSNKPTINKPATVTAKVTLNEVESATTTGKYFDTDPSPFTLISGADPVNLVLTPAIDESDGISITSISGVESNVTYDAGTGNISSSTVGSFNGQVSMSSTDGKTVILNNNFTATFTIQIDISQAVITLDNTELIYNGNEQTVSVQKVMVGDDVVPQDYYEISGNTGTEMGNYTLTVTAKTRDSQGNPFNNIYTGTATKVWKITNYYTATATELGFSTETQTASTYYNPSENLNLPEGYVGYIITGVEGSKVLTTRISYIPKGVAVLVEKGTSTENPIEEIPDASEQPLKGTSEPLDVTSITGGIVYVLYNGMFVKSTSGTIPEKRCYLLIATNMAAGTRAFGITHGDGTTGIKGVKGEKRADGEWYTLQGRRLSTKPSAPGLYLHNGIKVVIK
jgi:hypothetical protein